MARRGGGGGNEPAADIFPPVSKEKLREAFQFFSARVIDMKRIQQHIVSFTTHTLREVEAESKKLPGSAVVSGLWHDFLLVFFQYFIAIFDEYMALFTGDISSKRLRQEHKDFQHYRVNSIKSSTNASTYMGKWFSMASEDGLNIERRRAEVSKKEGKKLYKRRDMEALDEMMLPLESLCGELEAGKALLQGTLKAVVACMKQIQTLDKSKVKAVTDEVAMLFADVSYSCELHMTLNLNFTQTVTGKDYCYSRETLAAASGLVSEVTKQPLKVAITKKRLLSDPFKSPLWFSVSQYSRLGARQKRTIVDDDEDEENEEEEEEEDFFPEVGVGRKKVAVGGVVVKKRRKIDLFLLDDSDSDDENDDDRDCDRDHGAGSVGTWKRRRVGTSAKGGSLVTTTTKPSATLCVPPSGPSRSATGGDSCSSAGISGGGAGTGVRSLHQRYLQDKESSTVAATCMWQDITNEVVIEGVAVVFEDEHRDTCGDGGVACVAREDDDVMTTSSSVGIFPRSCTVTIKLSWVDMCAPPPPSSSSSSSSSSQRGENVLITAQSILEDVFVQLWGTPSDDVATQTRTFCQLPVHISVDMPLLDGNDAISRVYFSGDAIPLQQLIRGTFSVWCASEPPFLSMLNQFGLHWSALKRLPPQQARASTRKTRENNKQYEKGYLKFIPRPSFSLLTAMHVHYINTLDLRARNEATKPLPPYLVLSNTVTTFKELHCYLDVILTSVALLTGASPRIQLQGLRFSGSAGGGGEVDVSPGSEVLVSLLRACQALHIASCHFPDVDDLFARTLRLLSVDPQAPRDVTNQSLSTSTSTSTSLQTIKDYRNAPEAPCSEEFDDVDVISSTVTTGDGVSVEPTASLGEVAPRRGTGFCAHLSDLLVSHVTLNSTNASSFMSSSHVVAFLAAVLVSSVDDETKTCTLKVELRRCLRERFFPWNPLGSATDGAAGAAREEFHCEVMTACRGLLRGVGVASGPAENCANDELLLRALAQSFICK